MIVTERERHCVSVFSPSGGKLRSFGTHGSGQGQFNEPCGVAVDHEGNILVTILEIIAFRSLQLKANFLQQLVPKAMDHCSFVVDTSGMVYGIVSQRVVII